MRPYLYNVVWPYDIVNPRRRTAACTASELCSAFRAPFGSLAIPTDPRTLSRTRRIYVGHGQIGRDHICHNYKCHDCIGDWRAGRAKGGKLCLSDSSRFWDTGRRIFLFCFVFMELQVSVTDNRVTKDRTFATRRQAGALAGVSDRLHYLSNVSCQNLA